jgi:Cu2+-exporting ATPase
VDEIRRPGLAGTLVVLGDEQRELAVFELEDALRTTAPGAIRALRHLGLDVGLLSGDAPLAVTTVADLCGITAPRARCAPADKLAEVVKLQHAGQRVAMVGDGVNDAPVLAAADVSVAMGRGAALAQTQADFVLVGESLDALPESVAIARRTLAIARQNLIWAAAYNFAGLPLAALGWIPPWAAALGMSLSSVAVMLNALRLLPRSAQPGHRARRRPAAPQDTGTVPALVASS